MRNGFPSFLSSQKEKGHQIPPPSTHEQPKLHVVITIRQHRTPKAFLHNRFLKSPPSTESNAPTTSSPTTIRHLLNNLRHRALLTVQRPRSSPLVSDGYCEKNEKRLSVISLITSGQCHRHPKPQPILHTARPLGPTSSNEYPGPSKRSSTVSLWSFTRPDHHNQTSIEQSPSQGAPDRPKTAELTPRLRRLLRKE